MSELGIIFAILAYAYIGKKNTTEQANFGLVICILAIACGIAGVWL